MRHRAGTLRGRTPRILPRRHRDKVLLALVLLAFVVRLVWLLTRTPVLENEGAEYAAIARNILEGHGYQGLMDGPQLLFPPLYPLLIAGISLVVGEAGLAARVVSLVMGSALVLPAYGVARWLWDRRAGLAAGAVVAVHPLLVVMSASGYSEATFATLATTGVYGLARALTRSDPRAAAGGGAAFGLAALTRPEGLLAAAAGAAVVAGVHLLRRSPRRAAVLLAATALPVVLLVAPYAWWVSTQGAGFDPVPKTGVHLLMVERVLGGLPFVEAARGLTPDGRPAGPLLDPNRFILGDADLPGVVDGVGYSLRNAPVQGRRLAGSLVRDPLFGASLVLVLALVGAAAGPWDWSHLRRLALVAGVGAAGLYALFAVRWFHGRFAVLLVVLLALFAGRGLVALAGWLRRAARPRTPRAGTACDAVVLAGVCVPLLGALAWAGVRNADRQQAFFGPPSAATVIERSMGEWLRDAGAEAATVASTRTIVPFYAQANWLPLPYTRSSALLATYLEEAAPEFLVLANFAGPPPVREWAALGAPVTGFQRVRCTATEGGNRLCVYMRSARTQGMS